ncbi:hypothetical protein EP7_001243 [Isosphaeraceae bacterium EP7]
MSVGTLQPPAALYREDQTFGWWVYAIMLAVTALNVPWLAAEPVQGQDWSDVGQIATFALKSLLLVGPVFFVIGLGRLTTVVTPAQVRVWFGLIPTYRRFLPVGSISAVEVVEYQPIRHCGGWGIRRGRGGELVLNARGSHGVRLHLVDGSRILIGSQRPEELAAVIRGAISPLG